MSARFFSAPRVLAVATALSVTITCAEPVSPRSTFTDELAGAVDSGAVTAAVDPISVTINQPNIAVGDTTRAQATLNTLRLRRLLESGRRIRWTSSDTNVAQVRRVNGLVTGVGPGSANIIATLGGVSGSASVSVSAPHEPVAQVIVTLGATTITTGASTTARAEMRDASGNVLERRSVTWISSDPTVAMVDATTGNILGMAQGSAEIVATSEGVSGRASLSVQSPVPLPVASVIVTLASTTVVIGQTTVASASVRDSSNNVLPGQMVSWISANPTIASVNATTGLVTGVASGTARITATSEGVSGFADVAVTAPPTGSCAGTIWCDDFETDRSASYFEINSAGGAFTRVAGVGRNGGWGLRARFGAGTVSAGAYRVAFGRTPYAYVRAVDAGTRNYREVYWRLYLRNQSGWAGGGGDKLSRAMILATPNWAEAMVAHVWSGTGADRDYLALDPASGTDAAGNLRAQTYNDFANFRWLGAARSVTPIFRAPYLGQWQCVEAHVRLNTAGQSDGVFELFVNGHLEAQRTGLNWVGNYAAYGINALFIENFWNDGSPAAQERYFDDFVVSEQPIGCDGTPPPPPPPAATNLAIARQPSGAVSGFGLTTQPIVHVRDASGTTVTTSAAPVTAALASGSGTLSGSVTATAVNGVATFAGLIITGSGPHTIRFSSPGLTSVTSASFNVTAGSATQLTITTQPSATATSGVVFARQPVIQLRDAAGIPVAQSGVLVRAAIASGVGTLVGTATVTTNATGVATFTNLLITGSGSYTLSFDAGNLTGARSAVVSVTVGAAPMLLEDFSTYTSTADLRADPRGIYMDSEDINISQAFLDATTGVGASTKSMRYDFPANGAVCRNHTISRSMRISRTEIWVEWYAKYSSNFSLVAGVSGTCGIGWKFLLIWLDGGNAGRFGFHWTQGRTDMEGPSDNYDSFFIRGTVVDPITLFDGQWHRYRYHARISGGVGFHEGWIDDTYLGSKSATTSARVLDYMSLARNLNQGPLQAQSLWWGRVAVYNTNPGW